MSKLELTTREESGVSIIQLKGDVDAHTAIQLESAFDGLVAEEKYKIVVNCRELKYISSARLGVFMAFIEQVRKNNGDIKLSNIPPWVYRIMDLFQFRMLFEMFEDEKEAIDRFLSA